MKAAAINAPPQKKTCIDHKVVTDLIPASTPGRERAVYCVQNTVRAVQCISHSVPLYSVKRQWWCALPLLDPPPPFFSLRLTPVPVLPAAVLSCKQLSSPALFDTCTTMARPHAPPRRGATSWPALNGIAACKAFSSRTLSPTLTAARSFSPSRCGQIWVIGGGAVTGFLFFVL